jgi:hypothetical protein
MVKRFRIDASEIRQIAAGHGACVASDHIPVEGKRVGFMYRQEPSSTVDSGWVFLSGDESQDYLDDPTNLAVYDVNTIANYDPSIIPLLTAPIGSAYGRDPGHREFHRESMPDHLRSH